MPKTVSPGVVTIPGIARFVANAVPDPFDARDFEYRPRLEPLPAELDQRDGVEKRFVLHQKGNSCTGHAVAAVINTVLARIERRKATEHGEQPATKQGTQSKPLLPRVSPYMLYRLGRRYDEFEGEEDAGSSLRGVFKGWFYHGVALDEDWTDPEPDLDDPQFIEKCRPRPLGAFYRVNPFRLDDMQSAISELNAIAVSAVIHEGWKDPIVVMKGREKLHVIKRDVNAKALGGHAFALVGYNEVGFLVQNSWGTRWGKGGFATLPYEDWLESAYDAWVARTGVPRTPFAAGRTQTAAASAGALATAPGPDLRRLQAHVVNLGNEGRLSQSGKFVSSPKQIDQIFAHMDRWHSFWIDRQCASRRHIVLYAHGGLVSEMGGLATAQKHLNWWLNNRIYPIYFAWQSGPAETLLDQLVDVVDRKIPFGVLGFDFLEQADRLVEKIVKSNLFWIWAQMKENARAASQPLPNPAAVRWPPDSPATQAAMLGMPGASLTVARLADYIKAHGADQVVLHLVGHSAGSIFIAPMLQRLADAGIQVETLAYLAPAIRVDEFEESVFPHLGTTVRHFATFALSDQRELDDVCGARGIDVYHKSLLYLVSRALERPQAGDGGEVPLLGMQRFFGRAPDGTTLADAIANRGGVSIFSRSAAPVDSRSDATSHGGFDDDGPTMTSVVMRALGVSAAEPQYDYQPNAALNDADGAPGLDEVAPRALARQGAAGLPAEPGVALRAAVAPTPFTPAVETHAPGETPIVETSAAQQEQPTPPPQPHRMVVEVAVAPRTGSPILDVLEASGYIVADDAGER